MQKAGIPVVPGANECLAEYEKARSIALEIGYPIILKPSGGGGGIGMTIVTGEEDLARALDHTRAIAGTTFGLRDVYIEKYLSNPRHIEFQILADSKGSIVHLGERECSIQRRHQKLIEESPSTALTEELRTTMGQLAIDTAAWVKYEGAGTVEFLLSEGKFYFLEVNARIQVEHPVTEMVTGIDIVKEQIRIASGLPLSVRQEDVVVRGSALECRINAEDPLNDFAPTPGKISSHQPPGGAGVRVDSGILGSTNIPPFYDPMISKLIVWGRDRNEAIERMQRALFEYILTGTRCNIPFHRAVMENARFIKGDLDTHFIESEVALGDTIKRIMDTQPLLQDKVPAPSVDKKKIAAIAVAAAVAGRQER
jgi:pyruvate carboxylase subunit A